MTDRAPCLNARLACALAVLAAGAMSASARVARAQPAGSGAGAGAGGASDAPDAVHDQEAEDLIRQGLELREKTEDEAALRMFRKAYDLARSGRARALVQVALAEQALGRWSDAEAHLNEALRHESEPWIVHNRKLLEQALVEIQDHLGWLQLSGGVAGAEIRINGQAVGVLPLAAPLRVPNGSVALEAHAAGYLPILRTVIVPGRGLAREQLVFVSIGGPDTRDGDVSSRPGGGGPGSHGGDVSGGPGSDQPPVSTPASGLGGRRIAGLALGAAGVVALAGGITFHVVREGRAADFNDHNCTVASGKVSGPTDCASRYDDVLLARDLAIAGYVGAAVLGGVGAFLFFGGRSDGAGSAAFAIYSSGRRSPSRSAAPMASVQPRATSSLNTFLISW
jgi:hypothetical protein